MNEYEQHDVFAASMAEKYPEFFGEGKTYGGFAIGAGWYPIIDALCGNIQHHLKYKEDYRQRQLKLSAAKNAGVDALIKHFQGNATFISDWHINRAEEVLDEQIDIPEEITPVEILQIKEKFGGLRFYYSGGDSEIAGMVRMAEAWADRSCETCGNKGTRRNGGWIRTLCDEHEAEHQRRLKDNKGLFELGE